jgi:hypothetical protein
MTTSLSRLHELKAYVRGALNNGLTKEELGECPQMLSDILQFVHFNSVSLLQTLTLRQTHRDKFISMPSLSYH